jgi:hypothetical protein
MKIYKWQGSGHYLGATMIVMADCLKSAEEIIEKELIDCGLEKSWEETKEIEEIEGITYNYVDKLNFMSMVEHGKFYEFAFFNE